MALNQSHFHICPSPEQSQVSGTVFYHLKPSTTSDMTFMSSISIPCLSLHILTPLHPNTPPIAVPAHGGPWAEWAGALHVTFLIYNGYLTYAAPHDELHPLSKWPYDKCIYPPLRVASAPAD